VRKPHKPDRPLAVSTLSAGIENSAELEPPSATVREEGVNEMLETVAVSQGSITSMVNVTSLGEKLVVAP